MEPKFDPIQILNQILKAPISKRTKLIKFFQNKIWESEDTQASCMNEVLLELAYDMDFYEPNENWMKESASYYGDEHLEKLILTGIDKLKDLQTNLSHRA